MVKLERSLGDVSDYFFYKQFRCLWKSRSHPQLNPKLCTLWWWHMKRAMAANLCPPPPLLDTAATVLTKMKGLLLAHVCRRGFQRWREGRGRYPFVSVCRLTEILLQHKASLRVQLRQSGRGDNPLELDVVDALHCIIVRREKIKDEDGFCILVAHLSRDEQYNETRKYNKRPSYSTLFGRYNSIDQYVWLTVCLGVYRPRPLLLNDHRPQHQQMMWQMKTIFALISMIFLPA